MAETLEQAYHGLELEFSNVEILSQQVQDIAGRPGAYLAASYWYEGIKWLRLQAIVEVGPREHMVLLYNGPIRGPIRSQQEREPLFQQVLASLRLLEDRLSRAELEAALAAGKRWLSAIDEERLGKAILPEQFLKFELEGKPVGFVRIGQSSARSKGSAGVRIRERGWMFDGDGRLRRLQTNMFVSFDQHAENWKTSVTTLVPATAAGPAYIENALEEGLRARGVLLSSQVYQLSRPVKENPAMEVPEAYVSRVLARMLPQLVGDPATPRRLAFVEFDHQREDVVLRIVTLKGAAKLPGGGTRGKVYLIEQQEGVAGEPTKLYVDDAGRILRLEAGRLTLVPVKAEVLEREFASRVAAAEREMARLEREYTEQQRRFRPKRRP